MARKASVKQARSLRQTASSPERYLWRLLRGRGLEELKFRRQFPIGPYVADFVCLRHRLIVEVDGPFHDPERDARRDAWLAAQGFRTLRFSTHEVVSKEERVLGRILAAVGRPGPIGDV
jgi:very-short-patch-repair endonuclease